MAVLFRFTDYAHTLTLAYTLTHTHMLFHRSVLIGLGLCLGEQLFDPFSFGRKKYLLKQIQKIENNNIDEDNDNDNDDGSLNTNNNSLKDDGRPRRRQYDEKEEKKSPKSPSCNVKSSAYFVWQWICFSRCTHFWLCASVSVCVCDLFMAWYFVSFIFLYVRPIGVHRSVIVHLGILFLFAFGSMRCYVCCLFLWMSVCINWRRCRSFLCGFSTLCHLRRFRYESKIKIPKPKTRLVRMEKMKKKPAEFLISAYLCR